MKLDLFFFICSWRLQNSDLLRLRIAYFTIESVYEVKITSSSMLRKCIKSPVYLISALYVISTHKVSATNNNLLHCKTLIALTSV